MLFQAKFMPGTQTDFPFDKISLPIPLVKNTRFMTSPNGVMLLKFKDLMTNSQNTNCNNIYFQVEIIKNFYGAKEESKDQSTIKFVSDYNEGSDEKNLFTRKRILTHLIYPPQQTTFKTKVLQDFTLEERLEKEFLGKDKSLFRYSINDIALIILSSYDTIKISMMSLKNPRHKIKFSTMHEGFK